MDGAKGEGVGDGNESWGLFGLLGWVCWDGYHAKRGNKGVLVVMTQQVHYDTRVLVNMYLA